MKGVWPENYSSAMIHWKYIQATKFNTCKSIIWILSKMDFWDPHNHIYAQNDTIILIVELAILIIAFLVITSFILQAQTQWQHIWQRMLCKPHSYANYENSNLNHRNAMMFAIQPLEIVHLYLPNRARSVSQNIASLTPLKKCFIPWPSVFFEVPIWHQLLILSLK